MVIDVFNFVPFTQAFKIRLSVGGLFPVVKLYLKTPCVPAITQGDNRESRILPPDSS